MGMIIKNKSLLAALLLMTKSMVCMAVELNVQNQRSQVPVLRSSEVNQSDLSLTTTVQRSSRFLGGEDEAAPITGILFTASACPNGYSKTSAVAPLNGDLNQAAGGADIFFCVSRNVENPPITRLLFQQSGTCDGKFGFEPVPTQGGLNGDLNQDAGGADIYGCFSTDAKKGDAIIEMKVIMFKSEYTDYAEVGPGLNGDLNQGAGGFDIQVAIYRQVSTEPITGIYFVGGAGNANCPPGYGKIPKTDALNGDLNQGAGGEDLYFCVSRLPNNTPVTGVRFQTSKTCDSPWEAVPVQGINGDLNQGAGGSFIFGCLSREAQSPQEPTLGGPIVKMELTTDLTAGGRPTLGAGINNGDLNQGAGGKDIYVALYREERIVAPTTPPNASQITSKPDASFPVSAPSIAPVLPSESSSVTTTPSISPGVGDSIASWKICQEKTLESLEAVEDVYDDSGATKTMLILDGQKTITDDFSTNGFNNNAYRKACEGSSGTDGPKGRYVELSYEATCKSSAGESVTLVVGGQPRCYAAECSNSRSHKKDLFNEYTLELTEERADLTMNGGSWTCQGAITKNAADNGCEYETSLLNDSSDITNEIYAINPTVFNKKTLGIFKRKEKKVEFDVSSNELRNACEESGGMFVQKNTANVMCKDPNDTTGDSDQPFEVEAFFACLGKSCETEYGPLEQNEALLDNFKEQMFNANQLEAGGDIACKMSGALMHSSLGASIGAMLYVAWRLL